MKIIKINSCKECPYYKYISCENFCNEKWLIIRNIDIIPHWCPLEDN